MNDVASFRNLLSDLNIDFHFVDGPYPDGPAAGIDLFYDPPYYSFYADDGIEGVAATRKWLENLVARSGPYDAVMMFSQGCVLGASALLFHQAENPHAPPPFKAGIFICGGAPLTVAEKLGFHVPDEVWERDAKSRAALTAQAATEAILAQGNARWTGVQSEGKSEEELRKELTGPYTIKVPTVHIYGEKDPRYVAGVHLSGLCDEGVRKTFNHKGGHEIPRTEAVSRTIADLVRWALTDGQKSG